MASAIFISTILPPMAAQAMDIIKDKGKAIGKYIADKAVAVAMAVDKVDGIVSIERDIAELQKTLLMVEGIIQVAEEKQIDNVYIKNWLRDLVDIAYEARDVLDDFITFSSCVITAEKASNPVNFISSCMLSYVGGSSSDTSNIPLAVLNRLAKDIRSVTERFDEKKKEGDTFATLKSVVGEGSESVKTRKPVGPFINKQRDGLFLGRKKVKEEIMEKILEPKYDRVDVVVIWGMGGIGKTTLAQSIYNNESVKIVPRKWLFVGESKFCAEKVIQEIVNDKNTTGIENLQTKLVDKLSGDRFVIVLDDVWNVDGSEWDLLFSPLTNVRNGGSIIITTRKSEVCTTINTQSTYHLSPLSKEDSWSLFERCAYVNGESDSTPDLKGIGNEIVKKLNGLPLALKVVGRSLLDKDSSTWTNFLEYNDWMLIDDDNDNNIMSVLRWSYSHLPRYVKMCFTYCALFPKDHVFYNEKLLVEMWMAHDLIQKEENKRPEDVGADYFKQLVNASLLECVDGKYVMHDLIHDLALLVSNGEFASTNSSLTNDQIKKVRHITITDYDYSKIPRLCKIEKLLTLYAIENSQKKLCGHVVLADVFKQLKSIRVLVIVSSEITNIPDCIGELRHLRYLDVSKISVQSLPDSLCHLYNLQMIAAPCNLPRDVAKMVNLRYIRAILSTCKGVGKLTSLQELYSIGVRKGDNIREFGDMPKLRGKLIIYGLVNVEKLEDDVGALMEKQTLMDELQLLLVDNMIDDEFSRMEKQTLMDELQLLLVYNMIDDEFSRMEKETQVLDALGCPPNLKCLDIFWYDGVRSPSWMVDGTHKFDKLQTLKLNSCPNLESLPPLGELTSLKHLSLHSMERIKRLGDEFYGKFTDNKVFFPTLESLVFYHMPEWEEWDYTIIESSTECVSFFPRLITMQLSYCPKLKSLPPLEKFGKLQKLELSSCDKLESLPLLDDIRCKQIPKYSNEFNNLIMLSIAVRMVHKRGNLLLYDGAEMRSDSE